MVFTDVLLIIQTVQQKLSLRHGMFGVIHLNVIFGMIHLVHYVFVV